MTSGKRSYFVEKEEFGVELSPYVPLPAVEFQSAADPTATDVPPLAESAIVSMKPAATVSQNSSPRVYGDQFSEGINAIL